MDYSPKLAADGSNWGIYRARMVWRLRVRSLADHLTNAEVPESGTEARKMRFVGSVTMKLSNDISRPRSPMTFSSRSRASEA
ncbi:hypothetical protein BJV77DRAFT_1174160 [Russula vinacea]|nr:hypothetical protein BJV77DRAFT_1174160 [Russula vinacea]